MQEESANQARYCRVRIWILNMEAKTGLISSKINGEIFSFVCWKPLQATFKGKFGSTTCVQREDILSAPVTSIFTNSTGFRQGQPCLHGLYKACLMCCPTKEKQCEEPQGVPNCFPIIEIHDCFDRFWGWKWQDYSPPMKLCCEITAASEFHIHP